MLDEPARLRALVEWLRERGAFVAPVSFSYEGGLRGLRTDAPLAAGEAVFRLPPGCVATVERVAASGLAARAAAADAPLGDILLCFLLDERSSARSPFRPYLDLLPETVEGHPLAVDSDEEMAALLAGSTLPPLLRRRRAQLRSDHRWLACAVPALHAFSFAEFVWARLTVASRVFSVSSGGERTQGFVPLVDLLNHSSSPETTWSSGEDGDFLVAARDAVRAGTTLHDSYGSRTNARLFLGYGFSLDDNPEDRACLTLTVAGEPSLRLAKARFLGTGSRRFHVDRSPLGRRLLSFARVAAADAGQWRRLARLTQLSPRSVPSLGAGHDAAAIRLVADAAADALTRYATSIEEDERLLATALPPIVRACVQIRIGEKRVLAALRDRLRARAALLVAGPPSPRAP